MSDTNDAARHASTRALERDLERGALGLGFPATLDPLVIDEPPRACRVCGCTDDEACWPPCHWVDTDLCSACEHL